VLAWAAPQGCSRPSRDPLPSPNRGPQAAPGPILLLLGGVAHALAARLEASGYGCQLGDHRDPASWGSPDLVVLAVEAAGAIPSYAGNGQRSPCCWISNTTASWAAPRS
jgi:hypothetical protein